MKQRTGLEQNMVPPNASDLEKAVLGAIMLEPQCFEDVTLIVKPQSFYRLEHQHIFSAMMNLYEADSVIDILTVTQQLKKNGQLDMCGGPYFVSQLTERIGAANNVEFHARIIEQKFIQRELIRVAGDIYHEAFKDTTDALELLDKANSDIAEVGSDAGTGAKSKSNKELVGEVISDAERASTGGEVVGLPSPIPEADRMTGGDEGGKLYIIAARPAMGKGLPKNEVVATPNGFTKIKNINEGDVICNSYGGESIVTGVYPQGIRPTFKVSFSNGSEIVTDDNHLWEVSTRSSRRTSNQLTVLSTKKMYEMGVFVNGASNTRRKNFCIKTCMPVRHKEQEITIDPYVIGVLIGDGCLTEMERVRFSNHEKDIIDKVRQKHELYSHNNQDWVVKTKGLSDLLTEYELMGKKSFEKRVPKQYLYNSVEVRLQLLKGLIDTDGHVDKKQPTNIEYSTTSKELAEDVLILVRGLGGNATVRSRMGRYKKDETYTETRTNYRVNISFENGVIPVSSKKHLEYFSQRKTPLNNFITKIEPHGFEKTICISVDSDDHCFLTKDYLVTHNSSKALQKAYHISVELRLPVAFFSLEMTAKELMLRLISLRTGIDSRKIKNGQLSVEEWGKINESVQAIIDSPLEIIDNVTELMDIRKKCILKKKKAGLRAVFIDYLQLMRHKEHGRNREQEVSEISRTLKEVAKMLDVPVIALSQLSRSVETRGGTKRPMLSDLRESGAIEQDADVVAFLYRPEYYGIEISEETNLPTAGLTEYIIAKNRGGSTGTVPMRFNKETTSFSPWEQQSFSTATSLPTPSRSEIDEYYRSPMPRSQEFGDIDDLDEKEDEVF